MPQPHPYAGRDGRGVSLERASSRATPPSVKRAATSPGRPGETRPAGGAGTLDATACAVSGVRSTIRLRPHHMALPTTLAILVVEDHAGVRQAIARCL